MCFILPHLLHGVEFLEVGPMLFSSSFHKVHCYLIKEMGMMIVVVIYMLAMIMLIMVLTTLIMMIMVLTDGGGDVTCEVLPAQL